MPAFFITSSGTGLGKTFIAAALCRQLKKLGNDVFALKPVITGWNNIEKTDTAILLENLDLPIVEENIQAISPYRFKAALSPDMAARLENRPIDIGALIAHCKKHINREFLLIEGAGGVMVPLDNRHTMLDLMKALDIPAIIVVGSYLGAISHALTAVKALEVKDIKIQAIILNETPGSSVPLEETKYTLENHLQKPVFMLHRLKYGEMMPNLLSVLGVQNDKKKERKYATGT